ncbi:MAG: PqqD family protein [Chloroflexota bacterium]|nr:PqqD family protein [Chloroflexota bacterium]
MTFYALHDKIRTMDVSDQMRPIRTDDMAFRVFGDEAVVISPAESKVRMLNSPASRIWQLADGTRTIDEIATAVTLEYDVDLPAARKDVSRFVEELVDKGLLKWAA